MKRGPLLVAATLVVCGLFAQSSHGAHAAPTFKRGATLVEFFEFPATVGDGAAKRYSPNPYPHALEALSLFDFDELHRVGFDHMRVPLDVGPLMHGDELEQRVILDNLVDVVSAIERHGLNVLVTLFPPSLQHELPQTYLDSLDGPNFTAYSAAVERVATALAGLHSNSVALEPMNEPQSQCHVWLGTDWTEFQQKLVERIRSIAPQMPLFLTGGCWSNIEGIVRLDTDLLHDRRNFVSVHFYYPFLFTHQGATWTTPYLAGVIGVPYPATAGSLDQTLSLTRERFAKVTLPQNADAATAQATAESEIRKYFAQGQGSEQIAQWMDKVADWQHRQNVDSDRIVFTEFGAMKQEIDGVEIDRASRGRWLGDTAAAIASRGWGWTVYVLRDGPFGLYRRESDLQPDPQLLTALHLDPTKLAPGIAKHATP